MLRVICQTCQEETRAADRTEADEFVMDHVRRGHRVTRRPEATTEEHGSTGEAEARPSTPGSIANE